MKFKKNDIVMKVNGLNDPMVVHSVFEEQVFCKASGRFVSFNVDELITYYPYSCATGIENPDPDTCL